MIAHQKQDSALHALHDILVIARTMAYDRVAYAKLAVVLDWAETLPKLMAEQRDRTSDFHDALSDLAAIDGRFRNALSRFELAA